MDMYLGNSAFDGAQEIAVEKTVQVAGQSTLNANFGRTAIPGFLRAAHHFLAGKRVSIGGLRSAPKSAKAAANEANVGEINVAVDNVSDGLTHGFATQMIGDLYQGLQINTLRARKAQTLLEAKFLTAQNRFKRIPRRGRAG